MTSHRASLVMISISDEKPGPWRLLRIVITNNLSRYFNLRREARPLATTPTTPYPLAVLEFQSQTRSQAPGDAPKLVKQEPQQRFQSQTRSQAPGDFTLLI